MNGREKEKWKKGHAGDEVIGLEDQEEQKEQKEQEEEAHPLPTSDHESD
jgi:hypothetical protein